MAARMIRHYLLKEEMTEPVRLANVAGKYIPPVELDPGVEQTNERIEVPRASVEWRKRNFAEVEVSLSVREAACEAQRCLRCDLEFTQPKEEEEKSETITKVM